MSDYSREREEGVECDFCGAWVKCEDGSAFSDGTLFSNVGYDNRLACANCCGNIKFEEDLK